LSFFSSRRASEANLGHRAQVARGSVALTCGFGGTYPSWESLLNSPREFADFSGKDVERWILGLMASLRSLVGFNVPVDHSNLSIFSILFA
jgi:hypothetical protein